MEALLIHGLRPSLLGRGVEAVAGRVLAGRFGDLSAPVIGPGRLDYGRCSRRIVGGNGRRRRLLIGLSEPDVRHRSAPIGVRAAGEQEAREKRSDNTNVHF